ncbi:MAG: class I SAM-dependent methyltransferase [Chloroflexota bacterium]
MSWIQICPSCDAQGLDIFYSVDNVPVNSVLLLSTREEALSFPTGNIALGFCHSCGFIANTAFQQELTEYSSRYESTQAYSPTFNAFAKRLALGLIEKYDLQGKDIIEIGCGQGEFLIQLCELGDNRGIGFDPAYLDERIDVASKERITFIKDFYSEKYTSYQSDFVCCKMTLEHIIDTGEFIGTVRRSIGERPETIVYFQIPNANYVLEEIAFWDVYYEHCSYFSKGSLGRLFRRNGFDVLNLDTDYNDQYLMIEAKPIAGATTKSLNGSGSHAMTLLDGEDDLALLKEQVDYFAQNVQSRHAKWKQIVQEARQNGGQVVLWGGGSKAVAFLTTLGIMEEIGYAVDINPLKHGTFLPVTGQEVIAPERLQEIQPALIIAMNPIYCPEIQQDLDRLGIGSRLIGLE